MPDFSKVHYKALAKIIREADYDVAPLDNPGSNRLDKSVVVSKLCDLFEKDNPKFSKEVFIFECGL